MPKTRIGDRQVQLTYEVVSANDSRVKKMQLWRSGIEDIVPFMTESSITDRLEDMDAKLLIGTDVVHVTTDAPISRGEAKRLITFIIEQAIGLMRGSQQPTKQKSQVPAGPSRTPRSTRKRDPRKVTKS